MAKTYSQTYIFSKYRDYERSIYQFIINAERIDTKSSEFADILYDIKRRKISDHLAKIITSPNVVLCIHDGKPLPKSFKTFVASDVKENNKIKVFIDATDCIVYKNGIYVCNKLDWLVSYIINAISSYVYVMAENKMTGNTSIIKDGMEAWVNCFSYIIDRMYKISSVTQLKRRLDYLAALYYQVNILGKNLRTSHDSIVANAIRVSGITVQDAKVVDIMLNETDFDNIDIFVKALGRILKLKDIKTSNVVSYWMSAFGTGTVFALEYLPAFSMMMTNTYVGGYIDQQLSIEKIAGPSMVKFSKTILQIGASV